MKRLLLIFVSPLLLASVAAATTNAVPRGLAWLAAQQRADGSWSENVALNSLAVLAHYSAGHPPVAALAKRGHSGADLESALAFILTQQSPDGAFTTNNAFMYGHGITTLLLAESTGMTKQPVRPALEKSVQLILRSQAVAKSDYHAGGWRYLPGSPDSDLSVTVWQIVALKAARDVGVPVPRAAMERALAYVKRCEHPQGGFGYQPGGLPNQSRTAAAIVALRLCGERPSTRWLAENPLRWDSPFFYYAAHYAAHTGWDAQMLAKKQNPDGSWPVTEGEDARKGGPVYCTAMAILALTAEWKYLPAFLW